jgi:hypothetical protein
LTTRAGSTSNDTPPGDWLAAREIERTASCRVAPATWHDLARRSTSTAELMATKRCSDPSTRVVLVRWNACGRRRCRARNRTAARADQLAADRFADDAAAHQVDDAVADGGMDLQVLAARQGRKYVRGARR